MNLREAWIHGKERLEESGVLEAELDAWYLLEYTAEVNRASYLANPTKSLTSEQWQKYNAAIDLRCKRIPLQHITGVQEFMGLEFQVNEHVLIPRQDTESLVEAVEEYVHTKENGVETNLEVLDMCTGSGCIIISLVKRLGLRNAVAVDVSSAALKVAKTNASVHDVEVQFVQGDLFQNVVGKYDVIVSNPPYIPSGDILNLSEEVQKHDPLMALDGKEDGLFFYRRIIAEGSRYLKPNGRLFFEIGHNQGNEVSHLMKEYGFHDVIVRKDLPGLDRVVCGSVQ